MKTQIILVLAIAGLLLLPASSPAQARCDNPPAELLLVRHGCRLSCADPSSPLSRQGQEQAEELITRLGGYKVQAIVATTEIRTKDTAAPLADVRELDLGEVEATEAAADQWIEGLCSGDYAGQVVLHVGHSNTLDNVLRRVDPSLAYRKPPCAGGWHISFGDGAKQAIVTLPPSEIQCEAKMRSCCSGGD